MELVLRNKIENKDGSVENYELCISYEDGVIFTVLKDGDRLFQLNFSIEKEDWEVAKNFIESQIEN